MVDLLSSVFNYTTILGSYIGAIGYGIGYAYPYLYNVNPVVCVLISLVPGFIFDLIADKALSYKGFTGTKKRKIVFAIIVYITYLYAWYLVNKYLIYDLDDDFVYNLLLILVFQTMSFIMHYIERYIKNIRKKK